MKAAIFKPGRVISVEDVEKPKAGPSEVVLKVSYCGICGSDLRSFTAGVTANHIKGHEFSGVIAELGPGVLDWSVGQRVACRPYNPCLHCYECIHGMTGMCRNTVIMGSPRLQGAFAEYVKVNVRQLEPMPDEVTEQAAALCEPLAVALHSVFFGKITVGSSVAIIGAGPIGLLTIQGAKLAGAKAIYVLQRSEPRASMAKQVGADFVFDPNKVDFRREIRERTKIGADVCIECVGSTETFQLALKVVRACGRVILVGGSGPTEIVPSEILRKEIEIKGSLGHSTEFADGLELMKLGRIKTEGMITKVVPLSQIQQAFNGLLKARDDIKVMIAC